MKLRDAVLGLMLAVPMMASAQDADFDRWLESMKRQAAHQGIRPDIAEAALSGIELDEEVVNLDQKQPENKITLEKYLSNTITKRRIRIGKELMQEHRALLNRIAAKYHVQPNYLVALWGIESDYGSQKGNFSVVRSLATLAYEGRRAEFFGKELIAALQILQSESLESNDLSGSWAGAMGNCQFMPSTYLRYAVDGDGDGHRDIWNNPADTLASIANYLHSLGWKDDRGWGVPVVFPEDFSDSEADIKQARPAAEWRQRGVEWERSPKIAHNATPAYAIYVGQPAEASYLVTDNYKAILEWNRSRYFATAVGMLADAIGDEE